MKRLAEEHPDLFARALGIEDQAFAAGTLNKIRGLGRRWSWRDIPDADDLDALPETPVEFCVSCWDGFTEEGEL